MFGPEIVAFLQVIMIDLVLSGDNAVIIGALAAGLAPELRQKAIFTGLAIAVVARIVFSLAASYLLMIPGIMVFGGALLFWVAYKMYGDLTDNQHLDGSNAGGAAAVKVKTTFAGALTAITIADISMSLDNVLGVAGGAGGHIPALIFGLVLSVVLMAFGASLVSKLIDRYKWISWLGLALIVFVGVKMIYEGYEPLLARFV